MNLRRIVYFTALMLLTLAALPVLAQETIPLGATFTSDNGLVTFSYPEGWLADGSALPVEGEDPVTVAVLASNEAALSKLGLPPGTVLEPDEVLIGLSFGKLGALFRTAPDASAVEVLNAAVAQSPVAYDAPQEFTVGPWFGARVTRSDEGYDEVDFTVAYGDGIYAYVAVFTAPGALAQWEPTALAIAQSIAVGTPVTPTPAPVLNPVTISLSERFIMPDETLRFAYPPGWVANAQLVPTETGDRLVVGYVASSREAAQKVARGGNIAMAPNEVGLAFITGELTAAYGVPASATAAEIAQAVASRNGYQTFETSATMIGGRPAARTIRRMEGADAIDLIVEHNADTFSLLTLYTPAGELARWEAVALAFASLVTYNPPPRPTLVPLPQTVTSRSGRLQVGFPPGWVAQATGNNTVYLASVDAALEYRFGDAIPSGQAQVLTTLNTEADLRNRLGLEGDFSPSVALGAAVEVMPGEEEVTFGALEVETVDGRPGARVLMIGEGYEGIAMILEVDDGLYAATQILTAPGELALWESQFQAMASAIEAVGE